MEYLEIEGKELLIYPNPTSGLITVKSKEAIFEIINVYDQLGRLVLTGELSGLSTEINLDQLSKGSYTIQITGSYKPAVLVKQ